MLFISSPISVPFNSRPHTEVDPSGSRIPAQLPSFNSRPHTEVDGGRRKERTMACLSTHDLTRRSTTFVEQNGISCSFQLTTSHGGRLDGITAQDLICQLSTHDLTRRSTTLESRCRPQPELSTHDLTRRSTLRNTHQGHDR